jgi:hypothetical protein
MSAVVIALGVIVLHLIAGDIIHLFRQVAERLKEIV